MQNIPNIKKMSNGVVFIHQKIESISSVSFNCFVKTGSKDELKKNSGISHFLEHMVFRGTKSRNTQEIAMCFDDMGGKFNASTGKEYTMYYAQVINNDFEKLVKLISEMLFESTFPEEELVKERDVVKQEIMKCIDDPVERLFDKYSEICYTGSPISRNILGNNKSVDSITREDLIHYVESRYCADNIYISVVGNIDFDTAYNLSESYFSKCFAKAKSLHSDGNKQLHGMSYLETRDSMEQIHSLVGYPMSDTSIETRYSANILSNILGGGMSSRLFQKIREKLGYVYTISSFTDFYHCSGSMGIYFATSGEFILDALNEINNEIENIIGSITTSEIEKSKKHLLTSLYLNYESPGFLSSYFNKSFNKYKKIFTLDEIEAYINRVSIDSIKQHCGVTLVTKPNISFIGPIGKYKDDISKFYHVNQ